MDDLNKKIALRMQEVADTEFEVLASFLEVGSYTANQVFDHFCTIQKNNETAMWNEKQKTKKPNGDNWTKSELNDYCDAHRSETLFPECMEEVAVSVDSFKCNMPRYILFKILHKFEQLAGIKTKDRKKFIRQADSGKQTDISFQVEITKEMKSLVKMVSAAEPRSNMQRVALDYERGYVVASDGYILQVMKTDFSHVYVKEGLRKDAVLVSVPTFKQCQGHLAVEVQMLNEWHNKYIYMAEDGGYYEEDAVGMYPRWWQVHPKELFIDGRVTLSKDSMKRLKQFAKQADKNGIGGQMCVQGGFKKLVVSYRNYRENLEEITQEITIPTENEIPTFTIGFKASYVLKLDGWNGTMWITDSSRFVVLDMERTTDYLIMSPTMLPDDMYRENGINGTKVAFEDRHRYYQNQAPKTIKQETKINNPITPIFMAAERYEGTEPFYQLDKIENGEFRVKGSHDSDLVLFLRTAAHYIRRQGEMMQSEFCAYCSKQLEGKDWRSMVPMEELALAEMFEGFLASKGVNDIPDVEFDDVMEELTDEVAEEVVEEPIAEVEEAEEVEEVEAEEVEDIQEAEEVIEEVEEPQSYVLCITGTLNKSRKFYQEQIEMRGWRLAGKMSTSVDILVYGDSKDEQASTKIKQAIKHGTKAISAEEFYQMLDEHPVEVEDVVGETEVAIKPMAIEKEIVPTLELETSEGTLIVAGDSYFHKLYDEENGCFRSDAAEAKFNEIDAFIPDELITAEVLDYAAIAQAVGEFMEEVEQAS